MTEQSISIGGTYETTGEVTGLRSTFPDLVDMAGGTVIEVIDTHKEGDDDFLAVRSRAYGLVDIFPEDFASLKPLKA